MSLSGQNPSQEAKAEELRNLERSGPISASRLCASRTWGTATKISRAPMSTPAAFGLNTAGTPGGADSVLCFFVDLAHLPIAWLGMAAQAVQTGPSPERDQHHPRTGENIVTTGVSTRTRDPAGYRTSIKLHCQGGLNCCPPQPNLLILADPLAVSLFLPGVTGNHPPSLVKNIPPGTKETKVSYVASTPKPRLVKLSITPQGE